MRNLPRRSRVAGVGPRPTGTAGFTLIELLTVIAIIGILAAIVIPTVSTVRAKAQRAVDGSNLREILKAAQIYAQDNNDALPDPQNLTGTFPGSTAVFRWPAVLAKNGILVDPTLYFAKNDPRYPTTVPTVILRAGVAAKNQIDSTFTSQSMSWEFVGAVKMNHPATTPIIYTRGLQTNGSWSTTTNAAVYGDTGGYIGFLGGNVAFYPNTSTPAPGIFVSNGTGVTKTANVLQAIPLGATTNQNARIYGTAGAVIGTTTGVTATRGP